MKFSIERDRLLKPLQQVAGVVEKRQTMPVLSNVLLIVDQDTLSLTGTDLEVELVAQVSLPERFDSFETTVPAKKLLDICKSLPDDSTIYFLLEDQKLTIKCGRSRFSLATLPANEFPNLEESQGDVSFSINQDYLKSILDRTSFAMAQQDVRFYLNGMLFEISTNLLRVVSTDGHRLALCNAEIQCELDSVIQAIVPRKGVLELAKLFSDVDNDVAVSLSSNHICLETSDMRFTSKLIDGKFPDYERVLPKNGDKDVLCDKSDLKQCFTRVAILSNEKYRGVRLRLKNDTLVTVANNPEQEEAEEIINVQYNSDVEIEIGFNVSYLLDVIGVVRSETVKVTLADSNSSALISDAIDESALYVVMPMRL